VIDLPAVPVIDLSFATGSDLVAGLQQASCVFLTGLDSLSAQAASMVAVSDAFFALSEAEKGRVRWSGQGPWVGWQPLYAGGTMRCCWSASRSPFPTRRIRHCRRVDQQL